MNVLFWVLWFFIGLSSAFDLFWCVRFGIGAEMVPQCPFWNQTLCWTLKNYGMEGFVFLKTAGTIIALGVMQLLNLWKWWMGFTVAVALTLLQLWILWIQLSPSLRLTP